MDLEKTVMVDVAEGKGERSDGLWLTTIGAEAERYSMIDDGL